MSLANDDACRRKSIDAVNVARVRLQRKSDASAFSKATRQPSSPPASLMRALIAETRGLVRFWHDGHPALKANSLNMSNAESDKDT